MKRLICWLFHFKYWGVLSHVGFNDWQLQCTKCGNKWSCDL